jgi:hypothetical protein
LNSLVATFPKFASRLASSGSVSVAALNEDGEISGAEFEGEGGASKISVIRAVPAVVPHFLCGLNWRKKPIRKDVIVPLELP